MDTNLKDNGNVKQAVPFFMVKDMEASLEFYVKGIGFEMTNIWIVEDKIRWCWLQIGMAALMLQEYEMNARHVDTLGEGVSIYLICDDALVIYDEVVSRGVLVSEPFVGNKMWVVGLTDPDGYKIFFESSTDVDEETKYLDWKQK